MVKTGGQKEKRGRGGYGLHLRVGHWRLGGRVSVGGGGGAGPVLRRGLPDGGGLVVGLLG